MLHCNFSALSPYCNQDDIRLSGWDTDMAGGFMDLSPRNEMTLDWFKLADTSETLPVIISHRILPQHSGTLTLEFRFRFGEKMDETAWMLKNGVKAGGISLETLDNQLCYLNRNGKPVKIHACEPGLEYGVKINAGLSSGKMDIYVNGSLAAKAVPTGRNATSVDRVVIRTGDRARGELFLSPVNCYTGYAIHETFVTCGTGSIPADWTAETRGGSVAVEEFQCGPKPDVFSVRMACSSPDRPVSLEKSFPESPVKTVYEFRFLQTAQTGGLNVSLQYGESTGLEILLKGGELCLRDHENNPVPIRNECPPNLWYFARIIADPESGSAELFLNGKRVAEKAPFTNPARSLDGIRFTASTDPENISWIDDIRVYPWQDYPADYVPEPVPCPSKSPYILGLQSCTLYKEGTSYCGWEWIYPYAENRKPLLGWFDEENPEVMDWQIKWQAEHGIDYELLCWYRPNNAFNHPIKNTSCEHAITEALYNAKYSHLKRFAIMYENQQWHFASWGKTDPEDFRKHIIPYWIENFFKDPRYMKIDNKPLLSIYWLPSFLENMGGIDGSRRALEDLRQACVDAGFAGVIVMMEERNGDPDKLRQMAEIGVDYCYSYTWITGDPDKQKEMNRLQDRVASSAGMKMLPMISVGWEPSALCPNGGDSWASPEDYRELAIWIRDTFMPSLPPSSLGSRMVMIDNWNEFGEGHFIMPSTLAGFDYLDALRETFTAGGPHRDLVPDEKQKKRFNTLFLRE